MPRVVNPERLAAELIERWSPRVIGDVDDHYVKVAKVKGDIDWHRHADEDELFFVLKGGLRLEFEDGAVELGEGDLYVVPKGVLHHPVASEETLLLLFERKSTLHTGDTVTDKTRTIEEQLRPLDSSV